MAERKAASVSKLASEARPQDEMRSHRGGRRRSPAGRQRRPFITHAGCRDASQLRASVRPTVRRSVWLPGHCFTPSRPPGQLFSPRRSLFICGRDGHFADGSRRTLACHAHTRHIIALRRSVGDRACDERRQIAAGTFWINLLLISSVTSPRCTRRCWR